MKYLNKNIEHLAQTRFLTYSENISIHRTNPTQKNILNKLNNAIKNRLFLNKSVLMQSWLIINQIISPFNSGLFLPKIDDLILQMNFSNDLTIQNHLNLIRRFISQIVLRFENINKNTIQKYGSLMENSDEFIKNYSYVYIISDFYLFQLKRNCLSSDKNIKLSEITNGVDYTTIFSSIYKTNSIKIQYKNLNKDSDTLTNNFGFNLFLSLFMNIFESIEKNIAWNELIQCPCCGFSPILPAKRSNGQKNSLVKHLNTCPGTKLRSSYQYNNEEIPSNSIWKNSTILDSLFNYQESSINNLNKNNLNKNNLNNNNLNNNKIKKNKYCLTSWNFEKFT